MTEAELCARLHALARDAKEGDAEGAHIEADWLLTDFLEDLGYSSVVRAYDRIHPKWYV